MFKPFGRYILVIGVVLGLSFQSVASASAPCPAMSMASVNAGSATPDCATMHGMTEGSTPAKKMPRGCMMMAGCVASVVFELPEFSIPMAPVQVAATPGLFSAFSGRDISPEPEPPTFQG